MTCPDFVRIEKRQVGNKSVNGEVYQLSIDFNVGKLRDVVIQGGEFVAFFNAETGFWEGRENFYEFARKLLYEAAEEERAKFPSQSIVVLDPRHLSSKVPAKIDALCKACEASKAVLFNQKVLWEGDIPKREDYATTTMPYSSCAESCPNYDGLMSVLYSPEDRTMLEWLAGAALSGDGCKIDKFIYLEGEPGSGKSTFLNILEKVMGPYGSSFKAEELASSNGTFATAQFKKGPLVAIQHDGDLSKIETNVTLNNIISHEPICINDKYARTYYLRLNTLLFIASNYALKLTDSMSGLLRRCLDPVPTGKLIPIDKYNELYSGALHELGGIARRFVDVYKELGPRAYNGYRSSRIVRSGNQLGYWVERNRDIEWGRSGECLLSSEYSLYRAYCDGNAIKAISKSLFERQLKFFWDTTIEEVSENGYKDVRFVDYVWKKKPFRKPIFSLYEAETQTGPDEPSSDFLAFTAKFDTSLAILCAECPAQYAKEDGTPMMSWDRVSTTLSNIISTELHYVRPPLNHIVIDFDCRGPSGGKDKQVCFEKIRKLGLPPTYGEFSKSGEGVHLHYIYEGDPTLLTTLIDDNVEVKVFSGKMSLRRKFSLGNNFPIAHISSGIPLKEKKEDVKVSEIKDARHLENIIRKGLRGEFGSHKVTIEFIDYILKGCKAKGMVYDMSGYYEDLLAYASKSTNHSRTLPEVVKHMPLVNGSVEKPIVFFDFEVFPNFNCIGWKIQGNPDGNVEFFPTIESIQNLLKNYNLIGFNNKEYDNEIMYRILQGASPRELYQVSKSLIRDKRKVCKEAAKLSYSDIRDFCSNKQSLKKWEVQLGIHHQECPHNWDQDLPESAWEEVGGYCMNDVKASEAVFEYNQDDWEARKLLACLTGLSVNDSTNDLTAQLIFGDDMHPQEEFIYTHLEEMFPGYSYKEVNGKCVSNYHGREIGEGGYVNAMCGAHYMVGVNDVESMHPTSACELNIFGPKYTPRLKELVDSRKAAKNKKEDFLKTCFNGRLWDYMTKNDMSYKKLARSLKVPINAIYGLTSAKFPNRFKDPRNVDNIVAKRGELMMINLEDKLIKEGVNPIHIKTDSIKIPDFTEELNQEVVDFGKKYGYRFTIEEFYTVFCLFNKAEYLAYNAATGQWESRGATFQNPYVFKTLLGGDIVPSDYMITKSVQKGVIYIGDMFCGRNVNIVCVKQQYGKEMKCLRDDGKQVSVSGTKGLHFMEFEEALEKDFLEYLDMEYYDGLVADAKAKIEQYIPWDLFVSKAHDTIPDIPCLAEINEEIRKRGGV